MQSRWLLCGGAVAIFWGSSARAGETPPGGNPPAAEKDLYALDLKSLLDLKVTAGKE